MRRQARILTGASRGLALAAAVATGVALVGIGVGNAAPGDSSFARSSFLSGSLLEAIDPAALSRAQAQNDGTLLTQIDRDALDAEVLEALSIELGGGVQIPLTSADVGALGSYARAGSDGTSLAASGLVSDSGAIGLGAVAPSDAPGSLSLGLGDIIGDSAGLADLADLRLELDAISAAASASATGTPAGSYQIEGGRLVIQSDALAAVGPGLTGSVTTLTTNLNTQLQGGVNGLLGSVTGLVNDTFGLLGVVSTAGSSASITSNLVGAIQVPTTLGTGTAVALDLTTGAITVDLDRLNAGLDGRAPNTEILDSTTLALISSSVISQVQALVADLTTRITDAVLQSRLKVDVVASIKLPLLPAARLLTIGIDAALGDLRSGPAPSGAITVAVNALPGLPSLDAGAVLAVLRPVLTPLLTTATTTISTTIGTVDSTLVQPLITLTGPALGLVNSLISLRVNNQEPTPPTAGGTFTETALRLSLLPSPILGTEALRLDVGQAEVGPNALGVLPQLTSLTPPQGPMSGDTRVTITGSALDGASQVTFDGVPGTDLVVAPDGLSLQVTTPVGDVGDSVVRVQTTVGLSNPLAFEFLPELTAASLTPSSGPTGGDQLVRISGTCLDAVTSVAFGELEAEIVLGTATATSLDVLTPAQAAGVVDVVVTATGDCAGSETLAGAYEYIEPDPEAPALTVLAPDRDFTTGGATVVVTGTGFDAGAIVRVDGIVAVDVAVGDDTELSFTAPAHPVGPATVTVETEAGVSLGLPFTYLPVTTISDATPRAVPTGGGQTITVLGSCLTDVQAVTFTVGGVDYPAASFASLDSGTLTVVTPDGIPAGEVTITVLASAACGGAEVPVPGVITFADPVPELLSLSPVTGPTAGGTDVVIEGLGFQDDPATTVSFGGVPAEIVSITPAQIAVITGARAAAGPVDVEIVQPSGTDSLPLAFTYLAPPAAVIGSIVPDEGLETGGETVTLSGTGFTGSTAVVFGDVEVPLVAGDISADGQTITVVAPPGTPGAVDVTVLSPNGDGVLEDAYTYLAIPVPTVTTLTPDEGPVEGGQTVVLLGADLDQVESVLFDGLAGTITTQTPDRIEVTTPPHAVGPVDVTLTHPVDDVVLVEAYAYVEDVPPVEITTIDPTSGPTTGGIPVVLTGPGLGGATSVSFGDAVVPGAEITVLSPDSIQVTLPAGPAGPAVVTVVTPSGSPTVDFEYIAPIGSAEPPVIDALDPASGPAVGGTAVEVSGTGLDGVTLILFDGVPGVIDEDTRTDELLTVTTPGGAVGPANVTFFHGPALDDFVTLPGGFVYVGPAPVVADIDPAEGDVAGGDSVQITGTDLGSVSAILFGDQPATILEPSRTATSITVLTPPGIAGPVDVTLVHGPDDDTVVEADGYLYTQAPAPAPTLGTISPDEGDVAGGTPVVIIGTDLGSVTEVLFGGTAGVIDEATRTATSMTVTTPAGTAPGLVDVTLVYGPDDDTVVEADGFEYTEVVAPAVPTVGTIAPAEGDVAGGTSVVITGTDLGSVTEVLFGGTAGVIDEATRTATSMTVTTPAGTAPGLVDVTLVHGPDADTVVEADGFEYTEVVAPVAPTVGSIAPAEGDVAGGTSVVITGTGLDSVLLVEFGGSPAVIDEATRTATSITVTTPAGAAPGLVDVTLVYGPDGLAVVEVDGFEYTEVVAPAVPTVGSITPAEGDVAGGTPVVITGTDLGSVTEILFGDTAGVIDEGTRTATSITVTTPAGTAGPVDVTLVYGPDDDTVVEADGFEYTEDTTPPSASLNPTSGPLEGGIPVIISGPGVGAALSVSFGDADAGTVTVLGADQIQVTLPAGAAGLVDVTISLPDGVDIVLEDGFLYLAPSVPGVPGVTSLTPDSGPTAGGTTVQITGTDLDLVEEVRFGGALAAIQPGRTATLLTVVTPAGAEGAADVVLGYGEDESVTFVDGFTYVAPAPVPPTIASASPASGSPLGGTDVTLSGTGFLGSTGLIIGGVDVPFTVVDDSTITFVTPAHAPGAVAIVVEHPDGDAQLADGYTFLAPPAILAVDPDDGPVGGGTTVLIIGTGFTGATAVTIGGTLATEFVVIDDSTISVRLPAGDLGPADVVVEHPFGDATAVAGFVYREARVPSIRALSPDWGWHVGGTEIEVTGDDLNWTTSVTFNGVEAQFRVLSATRMLVWSPPHPEGEVPMVLSSAEGSALPMEYMYVLAAEVVAPTDPAAPGAAGTPSGSGASTGPGGLAATGTDGGMSAVFAAIALLLAGAAAVLTAARRRLLESAVRGRPTRV